MENVRASVAMAVYNAEKYIDEQIQSILPMLGGNDEIVISYDESSDNTWKIIKKYEEENPQIHCYINQEKHGVSGNFTNAARHCSGKYILFSDQDDVWLGDKINIMVKTLEETNADLAIHDGYLVDASLNKNSRTLFQISKATLNPVSNFYKGRFLGCCMAFRRKTMEYVLPFPDITDDFPHDIFAAILVEKLGKAVMVPECLIMHRLHENNETPKIRNPWYKIIRNRIILLMQLIERLKTQKENSL